MFQDLTELFFAILFSWVPSPQAAAFLQHFNIGKYFRVFQGQKHDVHSFSPSSLLCLLKLLSPADGLELCKCQGDIHKAAEEGSFNDLMRCFNIYKN